MLASEAKKRSNEIQARRAVAVDGNDPMRAMSQKEESMRGARAYATLFETGQYGRLYLVSGEHARGKTFRIFILPQGEDAQPNGPNNAPLNTDAVEVYGVTDGVPGWTETYGWLHEGPWQADFERMVAKRHAEIAAAEEAKRASVEAVNAARERRIRDLLSDYQADSAGSKPAPEMCSTDNTCPHDGGWCMHLANSQGRIGDKCPRYPSGATDAEGHARRAAEERESELRRECRRMRRVLSSIAGRCLISSDSAEAILRRVRDEARDALRTDAPDADWRLVRAANRLFAAVRAAGVDIEAKENAK